MARVVDIKFSFMDYPDPNESCIIVFLSGCPHNCVGCHNKEIQDINIGEEMSSLKVFRELESLSVEHKTNNIVFQGGDPLFSINASFMRYFSAFNKVEGNKFNICVYTGYSINYVKKNFKKGDVNFWKCGLYDSKKHRESYKNSKQFVLSSSNQNFYDTNFKKISKKGIMRFKK